MRLSAISLRAVTVTIAVFATIAAAGASADPVEINLASHQFIPAEFTVPANQKFQLRVFNHGDTPAEFESHDMKVEKIVVPGGSAIVSVGPLKPGTYKFVDDYDPDGAVGIVTVKE